MLDFVATARMIAARDALLAAEAHAARVIPIVVSYQTVILARHAWSPDPEFADMVPGGVVLLPKHVDWLGEADFKTYLAEVEVARASAGLAVTGEGNCPKLEAEAAIVTAQREFVEAVGERTGATWSDFMRHLDKLEPYIECAKRLLAVAPKAPAGKKNARV